MNHNRLLNPAFIAITVIACCGFLGSIGSIVEAQESSSIDTRGEILTDNIEPTDSNSADSNSPPNLNSPPRGKFNLRMPTMGGKQFWTDHLWLYDWRIQQNSVSGHWRLLDPSNYRMAWGSFEHCFHVLQQKQIATSQMPPQRVVITLHGLMRSSDSMAGLGKSIEESGYGTAVTIDYASTQASIADHAKALRDVVEALPGQPQIDFVAHSMGNIVIRRAMADWMKPDGDPAHVLPRLGKFVMLGPPNHGASIAKNLAKTGLFALVTGKGGMELGPSWEEFEKTLCTPPIPFGIVAGKLEKPVIKNPLVGEESDFVVSLDEARLDGMADWLEVPILHSFLMDDPRVQTQVLYFFTNGTFEKSEVENR